MPLLGCSHQLLRFKKLICDVSTGKETKEDSTESTFWKEFFAALTMEEAGDSLYGFCIRQKRDPGSHECPLVDNIRLNTPAAKRIRDKERVLQINSTVGFV
jgi:hypothetical protein